MDVMKIIRDFNEKMTNNASQPDSFRAGTPLDFSNENIIHNVIFVIDHSGSMASKDYPPNRLEAAKEAAIEYVQTLASKYINANIAVVSFSDKAKIIVPLSPISSIKKIIKGIGSIDVDGSTDIAAGLDKALEIISEVSTNGCNNNVVTITDGFGGHPLNVSSIIKEEYGVVIDVIGIGGSHEDVNEELLIKVATTNPDGTSHYRFIKDRQSLTKHYRELASGLAWKGK